MSKLEMTPLPEGSLEWEFVKDLSEQDANYIAEWMAKAFSQSRAALILTGVTYDEDPHTRYLFYRAMLDRGSVTGSILTNKTRTAVRIMFRPGQPDKKLDPDWTSPKDENWNEFLSICGGKDAFRSRNQVFLEQVPKVLESLYGEDRGLSLWRSDFLAVHPDYQGRGVGTALHNVIAAELKKTNEKWVFGTSYYNLPYYLGLGCKELPCSIAHRPLAEEDKSCFKSGNEGMTLVEYGA